MANNNSSLHLLIPPPSHGSFYLVRTLSQKYNLPNPLLILQTPPTKYYWKSLCRSKVVDWHEQKLRSEGDLLPSLQFFKPAFMSLSSPHPIWTCANSPYEVSKAVVASRMLSGRYRTDRLSRHWTSDNPDGLCRLPGCTNQEGNLTHILLYCPALSHSRANMIKLWSAFLVSRPFLLPVIKKYTIEEEHRLPQFLLDPSCLSLVISTEQTHPGTLKYCTSQELGASPPT